MKFTPINKPYMHGLESSVDNRKAEVVQAYENEWYFFPWRDGKQVVTGSCPSLSRGEAMKQARAFLKTGVLK